MLAAVVLVVAFCLTASGASQACSVCIDPSAESRQAFGITAVVLSLLPMALVGGTAFFIYRAARKRKPLSIPATRQQRPAL